MYQRERERAIHTISGKLHIPSCSENIDHNPPNHLLKVVAWHGTSVAMEANWQW